MSQIKTICSMVSFILVYGITSGYAQTCEESLRRGQIAYDQGRLSEIPDILASCLAEGFTNEEKIQAYRLLTLTYLLVNENDKADESTYELLRLNPSYTPDENDPAKYRKLFATYRTDPILAYGLTTGLNISQMEIQQSAPGGGGSGDFIGIYYPRPGFMAGISVEWPIQYGEQYLTGNAQFRSMSIEYRANSNEINGPSEQLIETQNLFYFEMPVGYRYEPSFSDFQFTRSYVSGRLIPAYRIASNLNRESEDGQVNLTTELEPYRRDIRFDAGLSVGQKIMVGKGYIFAEAGFNFGLIPINEPGYMPEKNTSSIPVSDPLSFKIHSFEFTIGYMFQWYKPQKIVG